MAKFMFLLRGGSFETYTPEEMQRILEDYLAFSQRLAREGKMLAGDELKSEGVRVTRRDGKAVVLDGPFAETKELIGGYWLIEEASLQAAAQVAMECPHLKYSGTIEIREVQPH